MPLRRRLFAVAALLLVAGFGLAKWAARWRPVKIGALEKQGRLYYADLAVYAAPGAIVAGGGPLGWKRFDLPSGAARPLQHETLLEADGRTLQLHDDAKGVTQLRLNAPGAAPASYALPGFSMPNYPPGNGRNTEAVAFSRRTIHVSPKLNRIEAFFDGVYFRWNAATGQLERTANIRDVAPLSPVDLMGFQPYAIARDGEAVIMVTRDGFARFSTRSGKRVARLQIPQIRGFLGEADRPELSDCGSYVVTRTRQNGASPRVTLFGTDTVRPLWSAQVSNLNAVVAFAPDEKTFALADRTRQQWQIRDVRNGALLQTLPLAPQTVAAAFSPDGGALYSLAGEALYRQRAR